MTRRPFGALIERRVMDIDARYAALLETGYPVVLGGVAETLQVARDVDRTNWLTLLGICNEAIAFAPDMADVMIDPPGIRTTSNRNYLLTYGETAAMIRGLRAWGLMAWANWGRMKDEARAVVNRQDLDRIDLEAGWP